MSESVISRLVTKEVSDLELVEKICNAINAPITRVFNRKVDDSRLTEREKELLDEFAKMSPKKQTALIEFIKALN